MTKPALDQKQQEIFDFAHRLWGETELSFKGPSKECFLGVASYLTIFAIQMSESIKGPGIPAFSPEQVVTETMAQVFAKLSDPEVRKIIEQEGKKQ